MSNLAKGPEVRNQGTQIRRGGARRLAHKNQQHRSFEPLAQHKGFPRLAWELGGTKGLPVPAGCSSPGH